MKNLLFLAGLIMVTAACSSGSSGTNMTTSENDKEANISFVYLGVSKKCMVNFCILFVRHLTTTIQKNYV